jgi:hypothetical protein
MQEIVRRRRESSENFLQWKPSIYRGEGGGQFKKTASIRPLRVFRRTRVHSDVRRVTFLPEFISFHAIGSSESTRFPEGLMLGNSGETLHPRNVGFNGFHEISFQVMCENDSRIWLLRVNLLSVSGWMNLWRSGIMKLQGLEIVNLWRTEVVDLWSSGIMNLWNFRSRNLRNSGIYWSLNSEVTTYEECHV